MTSSGSEWRMRSMSWLEAGLPGTMAEAAMALSRRSRRRSALRALASLPWQAKHLEERSGRTAKL